MCSVGDAYDRLKRLPFPQHSASDVLDEWILDLAEADAYIAGMAQTVLAGGTISTECVSDLSGLVTRLEAMSLEGPDEDKELLPRCEEYIQAICAGEMRW